MLPLFWLLVSQPSFFVEGVHSHYFIVGMPNVQVYLLDEPSSFLDSEQRIIASKVIKRFILHAKKTAFVIEHDFIMATYLADRVIVFEGQPAISATATPYVSVNIPYPWLLLMLLLQSTIAPIRHEPILGFLGDYIPP